MPYDKEKESERAKKYYEANREKEREDQKKYYEANREKLLEKNKKGIKYLSDNYVKGLLTKNTNLTYKDIPQGLIQAKRELIKIRRFIKRENQK